MNEAQVTMIGYVASSPRLFKTKAGRFVSNMRVGVTPRFQDRETGQWSDGETSYVTVTCWRALATNVAACMRKGDPIVVKGRMRVRHYDDKDGNRRTMVEVDASTLGHDLTRGVAHFLRTKRSPGDAPAAPAGQPGIDDRSGASPGTEWPVPPDEAPPELEHVPNDDFSAADLFDDAGIEASAFASGASRPGYGDAGEAAGDGTDPAEADVAAGAASDAAIDAPAADAASDAPAADADVAQAAA